LDYEDSIAPVSGGGAFCERSIAIVVSFSGRSIMRGILSLGAVTSFIGALCIAGGASANPPGVPVSESPPLSCTTSGGNFLIKAGDPFSPSFCVGTFPAAVPCTTGTCTEYCYSITSLTGLNPDHAVFAVSASQDLFSAAPTATVFSPGVGENTTGFLAAAFHEYAIRFDSSGTKSAAARITISGQSKSRIGTVLIRSGAKTLESCLIATPGITGDQFQPTFSSQTALVAGGKCTAHLSFDGNGNLVNVTTEPPCVTKDDPNADVLVNGTPLRNNTSPFGITFGNGTSTCYGPPVPTKPLCVCTKSPCP
jgi:hypothetical protein